MTSTLTPKEPDPFSDTVRDVLAKELHRYDKCGEKLIQIGIVRAGAEAREVDAAFGHVLDEFINSAPGLHDQGCDRVFWVEEHESLFAVHAVFDDQEGSCLLLVDRTVAVNPYLQDVVVALNAAVETRRRRMEL